MFTCDPFGPMLSDVCQNFEFGSRSTCTWSTGEMELLLENYNPTRCPNALFEPMKNSSRRQQDYQQKRNLIYFTLTMLTYKFKQLILLTIIFVVCIFSGTMLYTASLSNHETTVTTTPMSCLPLPETPQTDTITAEWREVLGEYNPRTYSPSKGQQQLKQSVKDAVAKGKRVQVELGCGSSKNAGFICTDIHNLNVTNFANWAYVFEDHKVQGIFSEHMFEHLTPVETFRAIRLMKQFLAPSDTSFIRIAVPDGYHPSSEYQLYIKAGSIKSGGGHEHMIVWNHYTLGEMFTSQGFQVEPLEYFDVTGKFNITKKWTDERGRVIRSVRYDKRNSPGNPYAMTSLILDATLPKQAV